MSGAALSQALSLSAWDNFYVLIGTSAGALTGLTFIVITIANDARGESALSAKRQLLGVRAFVTPTVVHFSVALGLSAMVEIPGQSARSLAACLGMTGLAGIVYTGRVIAWMRQMSTDYQPFVSDWIWSAVLPLIAYVGLAAVAGQLLHGAPASLYLLAVVMLLLLFIGIHNAWDVVAWMTTERHVHRERERERRRTAR